MACNRLVYVIFSFSLASVLQGSPAGDRVIKSSVSPEKGSVGEQFTYTVSIAGKDIDSIKIELPERGEYFPQPEKADVARQDNKEKQGDKPEEGNTVPLYIINSAMKDESRSENMAQTTVQIGLTFYRTGVHLLPELSLTDSDGVKIGYSIPSVTVEEINKEGKPEDIEPPLELSGNYTRLIILIIALIASAAAGYFIYRYFKNKRKQYVVPEQGLTPFEFFKSEIERLALREAIDDGRINDYVFGISITFRRFLSMEFGFDAAEMTTGELSSVLSRYLRGGRIYPREIVEIMETWDLSKFAEFTLSEEVLKVNLENIISSAERLSSVRRGDNG